MPFLAATALTALALIAAPHDTHATQATQEITARIVLTDDGLIWLRSGDDIKRIDMDGRRVPAAIPAVDGTLADVAVTPDGAALFRLLEPRAKVSTLVAHSTESGAELGRWEIKARGRSLTMAPDGTVLAVVGLRPGAGKRPAAHDWTLTVLDIVTGAITDPHTLGQVPHGVAIAGGAAGPTLYLATDDRILTYALSPLKASRFYTSPGMNRAVAATGGSAVLTVLRDSALAVVDPSKWSRAGGRIQLSDDDATSIVELDSPGIALSLSADGSAAFVLHEDHRTLSIIDTGAARITDTRSLDGPRALMAGPMPDGRIVLASPDGSLTTISTPPAIATADATPPVQEPVPAPPPAPEPPPAPPEPESAILEPVEKAESPPVDDAQVKPDIEPELIPPVVDRQPVPPPELEPEPEPGPAPVEEKPEQEPPPPAPPAEPQKAPRPGLSGTLTGNFKGAKEVLLYGPDNLLRLAARADVAADGTFHFDTPPPGRYRMIVSAGPNGQIYTDPRYRTIQVEAGSPITESFDFEIRGQL